MFLYTNKQPFTRQVCIFQQPRFFPKQNCICILPLFHNYLCKKFSLLSLQWHTFSNGASTFSSLTPICILPLFHSNQSSSLTLLIVIFCFLMFPLSLYWKDFPEAYLKFSQPRRRSILDSAIKDYKFSLIFKY